MFFLGGVPHINSSSVPSQGNDATLLVTCGNDVTLQSFRMFKHLRLECSEDYIVHKSQPLNKEIYKDGILFRSEFSAIITALDDSYFATYTFMVSTPCGAARRVSRILQEGQY